MDMKFLHVDDIGVHHLGYRNEKLEGDSWYRYLHPDHLREVSYKHRLLCQDREGSTICLLRLQTSTGEWLWLHTVLTIKGNFLHQPQDGRRVRHLIHATYQLVRLSLAIFIQKKIVKDLDLVPLTLIKAPGDSSLNKTSCFFKNLFTELCSTRRPVRNNLSKLSNKLSE
ncbi:unnamed protein product [Anisakis simplex]|uniref:PAS_3 domain-containing protein n=1 Tax=Anisakis simplex TaxID=6269 RepID=A0A0M3JC43_ANISI|nr:unnamed protein product [Anisakis simplex]